MAPPRRKKWTEVEERTLIDTYGEMASTGSLPKMKTREKKFKPVASRLNSAHHDRDPVAFPWPWTWKDVSTKVQNMRHQYLLVKQKIKKPRSSDPDNDEEDFDWVEGLAHWPNFLRYKEVFGDQASMEIAPLAVNYAAVEGFSEFEGMDLGFDYHGQGDDDFNGNGVSDDGGFANGEIDDTRKKRKAPKAGEKKAWGFLAGQLRHVRESEGRFARREAERKRERERKEETREESLREWDWRWKERENLREAREKEREMVRTRWARDMKAMEEECEERERKRREAGMLFEREWEERSARRRVEWERRMDEMLSHHRSEMGQIQSRILHEQQNLAGQILGVFSQWTGGGHPSGMSDHAQASSQYFSQMMQSLHHVNGIVHGEARVDEDNQDDHQFIVDG